MNSRQLLGRLALVGGGVFSALVLLELLLRFAGALFSPSLPKPSHAHLRILCLGESTTAPTPVLDVSWPSQLQAMLDVSLGPGVVSIINAGVPGTNTSAILTRLPDLLETYHPQIVIAMMGINDSKWYGINPKHSSLADAFFNFRVVKVARYIFHGFSYALYHPSGNKTSRTWLAARQEALNLSLQGKFAQALNILEPFLSSPKTYWRVQETAAAFLSFKNHNASAQEEKLASVAPPQVPAYSFRGEHLLSEGKYRQAEALARGVLRHDPRAYPAWEILAISFQKQKRFVPARAAYQVVIAEAPPDSTFYLWAMILRELVDIKLNGAVLPDGDLTECVNASLELARLTKEDIEPTSSKLAAYEWWDLQSTKKLEASVNKASAFQVTMLNYLELRDVLMKQRIQLIAMQYPMRDPLRLKAIFGPSGDITVIGNQGNFRQALQHLSYQDLFIDRFAGDFGHCTARGNALIAANVAAELRRKGLLSLGKKP